MSEYIVTEQMRAWGKVYGYTELERYADWFQDYLANRSKKYKDEHAAFRNCVRSDWPGFRKGKPVTVYTTRTEPARYIGPAIVPESPELALKREQARQILRGGK